MKTWKLILGGWLALALLAAGERPLLYPFEVSLGGKKAEMREGNDLFAVVDGAVAADALLEIAEPSDLLVVNAFPCNEDGSVFLDKQPAAIIFAQQAASVKLDATMDKKPLPPGTYLMNVVAHGGTSRVLFQVSDGKKKLAMPDLGKVIDFLKGKK